MWLYIVICFLTSIITILLVYIDARLFDQPKKKSTYIKLLLLTNSVIFIFIFLLTWLSSSTTKGLTTLVQTAGNPVQHFPSKNATFIQQIGEEMLTGEAPF